MRTWIVSDTHFGHENIIKYCPRPFDSVEEMDEEMIRRWRVAVSPDDLVYHLGDFGLTSKYRMRAILERLPGTKILVRGNHDRGSIGLFKWAGFDDAGGALVIERGDFAIKLCHRPANREPAVDFVLHGHVHGRPTNLGPWALDCSVELTGYAPVSLDACLETLRGRLRVAA